MAPPPLPPRPAPTPTPTPAATTPPKDGGYGGKNSVEPPPKSSHGKGGALGAIGAVGTVASAGAAVVGLGMTTGLIPRPGQSQQAAAATAPGGPNDPFNTLGGGGGPGGAGQGGNVPGQGKFGGDLAASTSAYQGATGSFLNAPPPNRQGQNNDPFSLLPPPVAPTMGMGMGGGMGSPFGGMPMGPIKAF